MGALLLLFNLVKPLQYLDLALLKGLLLVLELVLEALDRIVLAALNMPAPINVAETAATDELVLLILTK